MLAEGVLLPPRWPRLVLHQALLEKDPFISFLDASSRSAWTGPSSQFGILFGAVLMLPSVSRLDIALLCRNRERTMAEEICVRLLQGDAPPQDDEEECRAIYG